MRFFINDYKSTDIHHLLVNAWGEDNVVNVRQIQKKAKQFQTGERVDFTRKSKQGRPRDVRTEDNVSHIKALVEQDNSMSLNAISIAVGLSKTTVQRVLTEYLKKQSVFARWVPHKLTEPMKQNRIEGGEVILKDLHGNVMVIDEKWLYSEPMPPKESHRAWIDPGGD